MVNGVVGAITQIAEASREPHSPPSLKWGDKGRGQTGNCYRILTKTLQTGVRRDNQNVSPISRSL